MSEHNDPRTAFARRALAKYEQAERANVNAELAYNKAFKRLFLESRLGTLAARESEAWMKSYNLLVTYERAKLAARVARDEFEIELRAMGAAR